MRARSAGCLVVIGVVAAACGSRPTEVGDSPDWSGFIALNAGQVGAFELPDDFVLERTFAGPDGQRIERYQQWIDGVKVHGGQLTVRSAADGVVVAVIGSRHAAVEATNRVVIGEDAARAIAAPDLPDAE